ncbi:MAG: PAS domain S-box protein, partial [Verrucomicrobia bacterium]|nr:PAS domain S-box protein [Verrucomicrobiota bacterium]
QATFGYQAEEALGELLVTLTVPPDRLLEEEQILREPLNIGSGVFESLRRKKDGSLIHVDVSAKTVRGIQGEVVCILTSVKDGTEFPVEICFGPLQTEQGTITIGAIRDVASRKRVEEPLQRVSCMTSEFLSSMSHELRTPLNALIGFSEVLIDEKVGPLNAKQKEYLTDMLGSGRHLLQLLNGVLDFGKVETGQITLNPELFLPEEVIAEVVAGLGPLAQQKRITICQEVPPDAGPVYLDKRRFKQVLDSLLSTALSFTGPDGRVAVTVSERDEDMIELKVHDTGSGSRPADVGRLFVDFQQMDTTVACACPGIVLGLGLTRKMVELQGGTVRVESQPGQGSTFTVRLPQRLPETKCA